MNLTKMQPGIALSLPILMGLTVMLAAGCDCPKRLKVLQEQNEMLSAQVTDLENQLAQADAAAAKAAAPVQITQTPAPQPAAQPQAAGSVYTVVAGDSLWSIAQKQLGKGSRYKEILDLNPQISPDKLTIGTKLKLPPR